ncbi:MAG: alpha/beta hydrolase [Enterobacterales bacterium]|nr:alpha/beta hydrolase [Enterobacterales bacterium]
MSQKPQIIFSHGKESGPYGMKITAMTKVAKELGFSSVSLDYQGIDEPQVRVEKLLDYANALKQSVVLVGSSMGSYVSIKASQELTAKGLFLLAPAVFMPGYESQNMQAVAEQVLAIHGWHDEIVPVANAIRFAEQVHCDLLLLEDDHVLRNSLPRICIEFRAFLKRLS